VTLEKAGVREITVADYSLAVFKQGAWVTVEDVVDNYQHLRGQLLKHPMKTARLRMVAYRTNGLDPARMMEVRVYQ
jgi:hypothetical protein